MTDAQLQAILDRIGQLEERIAAVEEYDRLIGRAVSQAV